MKFNPMKTLAALCLTLILAIGGNVSQPSRAEACVATLSLTHAGPSGCPSGGSPPAIDGSVASGATSSPATVVLTTAHSNDLIIVAIAINSTGAAGPATTTITDSLSAGGHAWTCRGLSVGGGCSLPGFGGQIIETYYNCSASPLSSDSITVTDTSGGNTYIEIQAFGISGAGTCPSSAFDPNGSLPASSTGGNLTISTTNADDLVFMTTRSATGTPPAGWTAVQIGSFMSTYYHTYTSPQTSLSVPDGASSNGNVADAAQN
jgi:hypothetical protein